MNETDDCMSIEQFGTLRNLVVNHIDEYFGKILYDSTRSEQVTRFLVTTYTSMSPSTTLLPEVLASLTQDLFGNPNIREAIMNLSSSLVIMLSLNDFTYSSLVNTLSRGITLMGNTCVKASLIPAPLAEGWSIPQENNYVTQILTANPWIVTVILVQLFYQYTDSYKSVLAETAGR